MRLRTLPEAAVEADVEYRTLHSWVGHGLLRLQRPPNGSGRPSLLTDEEVELCCLLGRLRRAGCGMSILRLAVEAHVPDARLTKLPLPEGLTLTVARDNDRKEHR